MKKTVSLIISLLMLLSLPLLAGCSPEKTEEGTEVYVTRLVPYMEQLKPVQREYTADEQAAIDAIYKKATNQYSDFANIPRKELYVSYYVSEYDQSEHATFTYCFAGLKTDCELRYSYYPERSKENWSFDQYDVYTRLSGKGLTAEQLEVVRGMLKRQINAAAEYDKCDPDDLLDELKDKIRVGINEKDKGKIIFSYEHIVNLLPESHLSDDHVHLFGRVYLEFRGSKMTFTAPSIIYPNQVCIEGRGKLYAGDTYSRELMICGTKLEVEPQFYVDSEKLEMFYGFSGLELIRGTDGAKVELEFYVTENKTYKSKALGGEIPIEYGMSLTIAGIDPNGTGQVPGFTPETIDVKPGETKKLKLSFDLPKSPNDLKYDYFTLKLSYSFDAKDPDHAGEGPVELTYRLWFADTPGLFRQWAAGDEWYIADKIIRLTSSELITGEDFESNEKYKNYEKLTIFRNAAGSFLDDQNDPVGNVNEFISVKLLEELACDGTTYYILTSKADHTKVLVKLVTSPKE